MASPLLFLSHAGEDATAVKEFARRLEAAGLRVWLDLDRLQPGDRWMKELEVGLKEADAFAVYVGRSGVRNWVDREVRVALDRNTADPSFRLIPVLGPGSDPQRLPFFLAQHQWVDLRQEEGEPKRLQQIVGAILDKPAERVSLLPPDQPPFRGLSSFDVDHALLFFGRDREVDELLRRVRAAPFLAVVGDSGSGKSSLVRAGLIPALMRGRFHDGRSWAQTWRIAICRPDNDPFRELANTLPDLDPEMSKGDRIDVLAQTRKQLAEGTLGLYDTIIGVVPRSSRTLLVIDQFEELFTLTKNASVRSRFIDTLFQATDISTDRPVHVLITMRADFYSRCWQHEDLPRRISANQYAVRRMPSSYLRQVIQQPLDLAGAEFDPGLVDRMLEELGSEPGNLPLLEHALLQLWERREGNRLTADAYKAIGGVKGALGFHAGDVYKGLSDGEKALARKMFLRLTQPGEGTEDTRRRAGRDEILALGEDPALADRVLDTLSYARLVTAGREDEKEVVEVAHEALIREWPQLRNWLDESRDALRTERRIIEAAADWVRSNRDPDALYRGARLVEAEVWATEHGEDLSPEQTEYLAASRKAESSRIMREQRQLRRQAALQRRVGVATVVALLITLVAAWTVINGQRNLGRSESLMLARTAQQFCDTGDFLRGLRLSILASRDTMLSPATPEARASFSSNAQAFRERLTFQHNGPVNGAAFLQDESRVITWSDDGTVQLWNAVTGEKVGPALTHNQEVTGLNLSRDERLLLSWSSDIYGSSGDARLWDLETATQIGSALQDDGRGVKGAVFAPDESRVLSWSLDHAQIWDLAKGAQIGPDLRHGDWGHYVAGAVFSHNGNRVLTWSGAISGGTGDVRLWDAATGAQIGPALQHADVSGAAFSQDDSRVLTWSYDSTVRLWDTVTGSQIGPAFQSSGHITGAAFSKDESRVLTWSGRSIGAPGDFTARLWNAHTGTQIGPALQHEAPLEGAKFSQDESRVLTWSWDKTARVWDVATGEQIGSVLEHDWVVIGAVFFHDETRILTWSGDGTARIWDAVTNRQIGPALRHDSTVNGASFSHDETRILTWSEDGTARLWDAAGTNWQIVPSLQHDEGVSGATFSQDGTHVLTWGFDKTARLWDAATGVQVGPALLHDEIVEGAAFSKDESLVLSWSGFAGKRRAGDVRLWDAATGAQIGPTLQHQQAVFGAAFSQDENRILSWSGDFYEETGDVRLWDVMKGTQIGPALRHEGAVSGAAFSQGEDRVLTCSQDGSARLWDVATGRQIGPAFMHDDDVLGALFSKDESRVLTWSGNAARLWDVATGLQIGPALEHDDGGHLVLGAAFLQGEDRVLTSSQDGSARLWDVATGAQIGVFQHEDIVRGAVFSRDESRLLTFSNDNTARLWDVATGRQIGPALEHGGVGIVYGATFSRDESRVLTWGDDKTARLWDAATGTQIGLAFQHEDIVGGAVFSPDESRVLTWSYDDTARLWDVRWAMEPITGTDYLAQICEVKLQGEAIEMVSVSFVNGETVRSLALKANGEPLLRGPRRLDAQDIEAAPILRGREGEDVCDWSPPWYDRVLRIAIGWAFP